VRFIDKAELDQITIGASILATGGGGDPYIGNLMARAAIEKYGPIKLISVDELDDSDLVVSTGMIGAPTVMIEKIPNGHESVLACERIAKLVGRPLTAVYPIEAGGINSLLPIVTAAALGIPIVDMDAMGRAFPEFQMTTLHLDGVSGSPFVVVDEKSNIGVVETDSAIWTEKIARSICARMGGAAIFSAFPISASEARRSGIAGILSFEQTIGETVQAAQKERRNPIEALLTLLNARKLFTGKVVEVDRRTEGGFSRGIARLDGMGTQKGRRFEVSFQNEFLLAQSNGRPLCMTPDLISLLDEETGLPILAERLRYGSRVVAVGIPANEKWRTAKGIEVAGPRYFKYDMDYVPVEKLAQAAEVTE
jgi:uncharacterized protein